LIEKSFAKQPKKRMHFDKSSPKKCNPQQQKIPSTQRKKHSPIVTENHPTGHTARQQQFAQLHHVVLKHRGYRDVRANAASANVT